MFKAVTLEMSLKPFKKTDREYVRGVCRELFSSWRALLLGREEISVMLWVGDGSEILDYSGELDSSFEWAYYLGTANNPDLTPDAEQLLSERISGGSVFNFKASENLGIFAAVFTVFAVELICELVKSITFIVECDGVLFLDEIIYMTACYLFLLVELLIGQALCGLIKNIATKQKIKKTSEE